ALNGDKLTFSVPARSKTSAYKVGRLYHVVVIRDVTAEQIESAVLTVIDDTEPVISGVKNYYYEQPLSINADEPMMLSAFQVERTLYANGAVTVADVTAQFEAVHKNNGKTVELAHRAGTYTEHNSEYRFTITGLTDLAGNRPATSGAMKADGRFISVSKTLDREAPVNVRLINDATGELINGATVLKRAKVHCLRIVADDNMSASDKLSYKYRISQNQGLNYGPELTQGGNVNAACSKGAIAVSVGINQADLTLKMLVSDGSQMTEKVQSVALIDPQINFAGFTTAPEIVEEVSDSRLIFTISGDVEFIKGSAVQTQIFERGTCRNYTTSTSIANGQATVRADVDQPMLEDMVLDYQSEQSREVPVRVIVLFGIDGQKVLDASFVQHKDITSPEVRILSPQDGGYIPWDMPLDVLVRFFDRYGVEKVEASVNGGNWFVL